jgi:anti-sigma factor RsiW
VRRFIRFDAVDHQLALSIHLTERYVLGELGALEARDFEDHFFACPACADDVMQTIRLIANLKAAFLRRFSPPELA